MRFEPYRSKPSLFRRGDWRWRLKTNEGETIAVSSKGYRSLADCVHSVHSVQQFSAQAEVGVPGTKWISEDG